MPLSLFRLQPAAPDRCHQPNTAIDAAACCLSIIPGGPGSHIQDLVLPAALCTSYVILSARPLSGSHSRLLPASLSLHSSHCSRGIPWVLHTVSLIRLKPASCSSCSFVYCRRYIWRSGNRIANIPGAFPIMLNRIIALI